MLRCDASLRLASGAFYFAVKRYIKKMDKEKIKKVVLAYSGGLDTSVAIKWLKENYNCEVIAFAADLGQGEELTPLRKKALKTGASKIYIQDLKEEFVSDFIFPMLRANAVYEGTYLLGTSIAFLLLAIFMTYTVAGTLDFSDNGILIDTTAMGVSDTFLTITFILFMAGIAKAAMMPLHSWLPAAMVAPTPVSALLHAVVVVKAGVFVVVKVVIHIFGIDLLTKLGLGTALAYFSSFTIIIASIIALKQDNLKRMLAFSTISQLSYIILGAALLKPSSMVGGIIHITNHAFSKITLFFCAGSIYVSAHKTEISQLSGIGKKMPWTMAAFFIGSLSMIGVPPTAVGSMEAKEIPILVVLLFSSVLNAAYFLPITYKAFFEKENHTDHHEEVKEIPVVVIPLVITAIISILVGIYPDYFLTLAKEVIR